MGARQHTTGTRCMRTMGRNEHRCDLVWCCPVLKEGLEYAVKCRVGCPNVHTTRSPKDHRHKWCPPLSMSLQCQKTRHTKRTAALPRASTRRGVSHSVQVEGRRSGGARHRRGQIANGQCSATQMREKDLVNCRTMTDEELQDTGVAVVRSVHYG